MTNNNTDLKVAFDSITAKASDYNELWSYYDGNAKLKYSTERLSRAFGKSFVYFAQNWAGVIVNSVLDRLVLKGFDANNVEINKILDGIFNKLGLKNDAYDVHEALQVLGEAYLFVDKVEDNVEVYFNDPRMCEMFYNPDRPKVKAYAAKLWKGQDGLAHMNLYYPNRTEKYISQKGTTANSFSLEETVANPTGVIPVFHFKNSRRIIKGELDSSVTSIIDAINKLFSDMMVAAEFEAFKMRVFISQTDPGEVEIGPDMKLWLPAREGDGQDANVLELGGSQLDNFLKPMVDLANTLAITTSVPKHYFYTQTQAPSGESLLVMESGLVKKVQKKQEAYEPTWKEVATYILSLMGREVNQDEISVIWEPAQSSQPLTEAQIIKTEKEAGIPLITSFRRLGADDTDIAQLEKDMSDNNNTTV